MKAKTGKKLVNAPKLFGFIAGFLILTIVGLELSFINSAGFKSQIERDKALPYLLSLNESKTLSAINVKELRQKLAIFNVVYKTDFTRTPPHISFVSPIFHDVSTIGKNNDIPIGLPTWDWELKGYCVVQNGKIVELKILQHIYAF